jgi:hypothetical protein
VLLQTRDIATSNRADRNHYICYSGIAQPAAKVRATLNYSKALAEEVKEAIAEIDSTVYAKLVRTHPSRDQSAAMHSSNPFRFRGVLSDSVSFSKMRRTNTCSPQRTFLTPGSGKQV